MACIGRAERGGLTAVGIQCAHVTTDLMTMDDRIRREIHDRLQDSYVVDPESIEVTVRGGIVILDGDCPERALKRMIEFIAECVEGVLQVESHLRVPRAGSTAPEAGS